MKPPSEMFSIINERRQRTIKISILMDLVNGGSPARLVDRMCEAGNKRSLP